ncbi:MAG: aminotransferase class III-fold pyridoxal phosphate-dependent enzyme, partial [Candidatus Bipolaricaulota bacterium]
MNSKTLDFADLHYAEAPDIQVTPPGPKSQVLLDRQKKHETSAISYPRSTPLAIDSARGATLKDVDGNVYLDFFGGAGVLNVGQLNPVVVDAVEEQLGKLVHSLDFPTEVRTEFAEKLLEIAP